MLIIFMKELYLNFSGLITYLGIHIFMNQMAYNLSKYYKSILNIISKKLEKKFYEYLLILYWYYGDWKIKKFGRI